MKKRKMDARRNERKEGKEKVGAEIHNFHYFQWQQVTLKKSINGMRGDI